MVTGSPTTFQKRFGQSSKYAHLAGVAVQFSEAVVLFAPEHPFFRVDAGVVETCSQ